ncbi:MAG: outer membrane beta-barrel protein [Ignavibacteria bacterium]
MKIAKITTLVLLLFATGVTFSQLSIGELKLKSADNTGLNLSTKKSASTEVETKLFQKPTKKIYFVPGGKIGMFFLQGDYNGNQMIALEIFGKYVGDGFWAEISLPFRFKTSPAFTDIGLDINVMYPFLGSKNKSEVDPFVGGGLGLHFIGRDRDDPDKSSVAARGGLGLNLIAGAVFFRNYDFNIMVELKYFNYLREFDDKRYQGIGLNVGVTFPK